MNDALFEYTNKASYFLWENTRHDQALNLWYCVEDMACYFEQVGILTAERVDAIRRLGVNDPAYVHFLRHMAYRIYVYTNQPHAETNWFAGERLVANGEWVSAVADMAAVYREQKTSQASFDGVRSENVRAYYASNE